MPIASLLAALVLLAAASGAAQPPGDTDPAAEATRLSQEAGALYRAGRFAEAVPLMRRALAITEQALGSTHPIVATGLNNLAVLLKTTGDYAGARVLYERALAIDEATYGPDHPEIAADLNNLANLLTTTGEYAAARSLYERGLAILERARGPSHPDVATTLNNLALLLKMTGDYAAARPLYERALAIKERTRGPGDPEVAASLNNLAALLETAGDYVAARPLYERALAIKEHALGPDHPDVAISLNNLAGFLKTTGDYAGARPLYDRALAIRERVFGPDHPDVATSLANVASMLEVFGDYAGARRLDERALAIKEQAFGPDHPDVAVSAGNLAALLEATGDLAAARALHERALAIRVRALGPDHPDVATSLSNLAVLLKRLGSPAEARPLLERALAIWERTQGPEHADVALALNNLAGVLVTTGDDAGAHRLYERALAIRERALGPDHPDVATSLSNLAAVFERAGDRAAALPLYERALLIWERALGPNHADVAGGLAAVARVLAATGQRAAARARYERARQIGVAVARSNADLDDESHRAVLAAGQGALRAYVALLAALARDPARDPTAAAPALDAFVVAAQMRAGAVQRALARAAARTTARDPATAALASDVEALQHRLRGLRRRLVEEYAKAAVGNRPLVASLQQAAFEADRDLVAAAERLRAALPRYAELTAPEPITPAETARLLRADEALVAYLVLDDRILVWVVRPGHAPRYRAVEVARRDVRALVARVRTSLDQSANPDLALGLLRPFDVAGAHALYALLIAPLAEALRGVKQLIVVPDDVLQGVPFAALVTDATGEAYRRLADLVADGRAPAPAEMSEYARVPWLAGAHAITVLPSATSLRALRQSARAKVRAPEPLIAFGDPVLEGSGGQRGGAMLASRGAGAAVAEIRTLSRLPATRDELAAMARALAADPGTSLYLGAAATKPALLGLNASGRLAAARVLAFATHGLIAGEVAGLREPALVLTPPAVASEGDDGLLGLADILDLRLSAAEWVVLSACNTAAGDGSGEGLAGLARAFFFAGAPTLLVSHWSVEDRATQALVSEVFTRYAADPTLAPTEALRQAMLAMLASARGATAYFAHPFAWAPFFVVGDGGAR